MDKSDLSFLTNIVAAGNKAVRAQLAPATRQEDRARQRCRRLGLVEYAAPFWKITAAGIAAIEAEKSK